LNKRSAHTSLTHAMLRMGLLSIAIVLIVISYNIVQNAYGALPPNKITPDSYKFLDEKKINSCSTVSANFVCVGTNQR
ncbi:MAG: hypothetical protein U1C59_05560, partial [Methylotenera sp.]|nr:hypothetical protein [Methylotenera sp.]